MMSGREFCELALSFPETVQGSHFDVTDFRVAKKVFATFRESDGRAVLKLTPDQQRLFMETMPGILRPVPGSWGEKGWTIIALSQADPEALRHAMAEAWRGAAPKTVVKRHGL